VVKAGLPPSLSLKKLKNKLEALAQEIMVDLRVSKIVTQVNVHQLKATP
jgi:glycine cleavage system regulatory protein